MSINPVNPSGPSIPPIGPGPIGPTQPPAQTAAVFGQQLASAAGAAGQKSPLDRATYERISRRIREAAAAGKSAQETLGVVVEDELKVAFGQTPSAALLASVCEQFQNSPLLKDLFGKLYRKSLGSSPRTIGDTP